MASFLHILTLGLQVMFNITSRCPQALVKAGPSILTSPGDCIPAFTYSVLLSARELHVPSSSAGSKGGEGLSYLLHYS